MDLMWAMGSDGNMWQAELNDNEYIMFQQHDDDYRRVGESRTMTRDEFGRLFYND